MSDRPLLEVEDLRVHFALHSGLLRRATGQVRAVENVSLQVNRNAVFGVVGESGSGKTTLGRAILGLVEIQGGRIAYEGRTIATPGHQLRGKEHLKMSLVFQDPFGSLSPRMSVGRLIAEPIRIQRLAQGRAEIGDRVAELLGMVGLDPKMASRLPHEFSGGQRQRIGIARALAGAAEFIVLDEPVSALDVSIQAQIINLLSELRQRLGLTFLMIAHDIAVVGQFCETIAVMYLGHVVEVTDSDGLTRNPRHPYTQALLAAVPVPDPRREKLRKPVLIRGEIADQSHLPEGCVFHARCPHSDARCRAEVPALQPGGNGHAVACHAVQEGRI